MCSTPPNAVTTDSYCRTQRFSINASKHIRLVNSPSTKEFGRITAFQNVISMRQGSVRRRNLIALLQCFCSKPIYTFNHWTSMSALP